MDISLSKLPRRRLLSATAIASVAASISKDLHAEKPKKSTNTMQNEANIVRNGPKTIQKRFKNILKMVRVPERKVAFIFRRG